MSNRKGIQVNEGKLGIPLYADGVDLLANGKDITNTTRNYAWLEKTISIRESGISQHHGGPLRATLKPLKYHSTMLWRGLREALNWAPLFQDMPISWTAVRQIVVVFPVLEGREFSLSFNNTKCGILSINTPEWKQHDFNIGNNYS